MDSFYSKEFKTLIMANSGVVIGSNGYMFPCFGEYSGRETKNELRVAYCDGRGTGPLVYFVQVNKRWFHAQRRHWYWFGSDMVYEDWLVDKIVPMDMESAKEYYFNDCDDKDEEMANKYFRDSYGTTRIDVGQKN